MPISPSEVSVKAIPVGGIPLSIYGLSFLPDTPFSVDVLFFLHGRTSRAQHLDAPARELVARCNAVKPTIVVTFDHRNHGDRLVDPKANRGWRDVPPEKGKEDELDNEDHAIDMACIYSGTAMDVSLLITYLPLKLWPDGQHTVNRFGCIGVSLGGHSVWLAGAKDARLSILIPIIGSPTPSQLLRHRAAQTVPKPRLTDKMIKTVEDASVYDLSVWKNKHILALCGAKDTLVPYKEGETESFVARLQKVGIDAELFVEEGAGHQMTTRMIDEMIGWLNSGRFR